MDKPTTSENLLARQIGGMLAYWRRVTEAIDSEAVVLLDAERQNLMRAVEIGLRYESTWLETAEILHLAFPFIEQRGYWQEWLPLLERGLALGEALPVEARVMLMARLGQAYRLEQRFEEAIAIHLEAEQLAKSTNQDALIGRVLHDLLEDYLFSRNYDNALVAGEEAIKVLNSDGQSKSLLANCYKMLGVVFHKTGESEMAETHLRTAVDFWRELNNKIYLARSLSDLAQPLIRLKKIDEAQACLLEAAELLASTIYEQDKCIIQLNLGAMYASQQNWSKAEAAFHKANSPYLRQSVNLRQRAIVQNNLGFVLYQQGRYEIADEYLRQSARLYEEVQDDFEAANTLSTLADSLAAQNKFEAALPIYRQVVEIFRRFPQSARARRLLKQYEGIPEQIIARQKNSQPA
jgi:tetratricopeptide (TPR) repeat protein